MRFYKKLLPRSLVVVLLALVLMPAASALAYQKMPAFSGRTVNGLGKFDSASLQGKLVLVSFWATWCQPCRKEIPSLVKLYERYRERGLAVVGISMDGDSAKPVTRFLEKQKVDYPVIMGDGAIARAFGGVIGLPSIFLINRKGEMVVHHEGYTGEEELQAEIEKLLN